MYGSDHRNDLWGIPSPSTVLGVIYGNVSTKNFKFAVSDPRVKTGSFVTVHHPQCGNVIGYVTELQRKTEISFQEAKDTIIIEPYGRELESRKIPGIASKEPGEGKVSAKVSIFGYRDHRGGLKKPLIPLKAGKPVYPAKSSFISEVIGLETKTNSSAYIGKLRGHDLEVTLDINDIVQKHISVIARTGSGKSYSVGVLVEELLEKNVPIIIIDRHGEYSNMINPNLDQRDMIFMEEFAVAPKGYASKITIFSLNSGLNPDTIPLSFNNGGLSVDDLMALTSLKGTGSELGILHQAIRSLERNLGNYSIDDIICQAEIHRDKAKWKVIDALERLKNYEIFSENPTPLREIVRKGQCSVIDLKGVPKTAQEIVVARLISSLYRERKREIIPPFMMVIEEAHNFCPQNGKAISSPFLISVASEGRKFGFGLCAVTQRPARVDKNLLSQCNTQIIMKITNSNDLKAITASLEGLSTGASEDIQRLAVGEAIVIGGNIALPIFVRIRVRRSQHGGAGVSIVDMDGILPGSL